jgi:glycosyltransferase involved in cell wall biosynthesis
MTKNRTTATADPLVAVASGGLPARKVSGAVDAASPTRVLIVAPSMDILGGQAVQAARLMSRLREEQSLEIGFLPINPRLPGPLRKLQGIKYVRTIVTSIWYVATLLARVRKYHVIHIFSASYFSFVLAPTPAILIAKLYGRKIVLNYHSGEADDHFMRWPSAVKTLHRADELVVPSEYLVRVFARFGLHACAIRNTIEAQAFGFRMRWPLGPQFLSNRNLESHYGVDCVLRAFAIIQKQIPAASLIVAGDGSRRAALEQLARELNLRNVEFRGQVAPQAVPALYDAADILLNGSAIDNQPLSLLEAFACGLPVVTTNAGGIPDIVTHESTGLMVQCGDYESMAREALRLLSDAELADGVSVRARAEGRKYSWDEARDRWLALYHQLRAEDLARPVPLSTVESVDGR